MYDLTFGLGVAIMAMIGVIALLIYMFGKKYVGAAKGFVALVAIFALLAAGITYVSGVYEPEAAEIVPHNTYAVTCTEAEAELSVDEAQNLIIWKMEYNTTANAFANSTGVGVLNFTVAGSSGLDDEWVQARIGAVPAVDQPGSAADIELLDENADGTSNAAWVGGLTASGGNLFSGTEDISVFYSPDSGSVYVTVTITLEATAFASFTAGDAAATEGVTWSMYIYVAGQTYTVHFIMWNLY